MQGTCNARALQRLGSTEFLAAGHQARHFGFSDLDFGPAPVSEPDVLNDIVVHKNVLKFARTGIRPGLVMGIRVAERQAASRRQHASRCIQAVL